MVNNNEFINSQTYRNLQDALQRELTFSTSYRIYEENARAEDYQQIGNIFGITAGNEMEHAVIWSRFLMGDIPDTLTNLQRAAEEENFEGTDLYLEYGRVAREEGYTDIANMFEGVAAIERHHYYRFNALADNIINNQVFCKQVSTVWVCLKCGNLVWSECAPEVCPICFYPQGFYELNCENY
ncbi:rubrerythrin family protein [Sedimentibacter hydroxybenzoicus DSM 7310]|uniref:Rubrerythrin family protein n=1 Tax=Sedimentibacter hydroxybenzoicus DSM 7310 TaxID=1123245 RepID=A0A974BIJ2_SEDHY|nr:ferritin family protein [Sedimentibacter hydroxybenzoicus]NYB73834.1 rubrerythrin family protein [Sedimentibacter hydroxybenzoicus DSM 7310]